MFRNYLKTAWRNLMRNPTLSLINLVGLSVSVAFSVLLFFHIRYEQSFDRFHVNRDRLFRLEMSDLYSDDPAAKAPGLEFPLVVGRDLKDQFPEVSNIIVFKDHTIHMGEQLVRADNEVYKEKGVYFADSGFLTRLSFPLVKGNSRTALGQPGNVVLSASTARKYFGQVDAVGRTIQLVSDSNRIFRVAGIVADAPDNSSIQFTMIFPLAAGPSYTADLASGFYNMDYLMVVELRVGEDKGAFEEKLNRWMRINYLPPVARNSGMKPAVAQSYRWWVRPLAEGHFSPSFPWGHFTDMRSIYQLVWIVIIILLLASLNYILITVSNAASRSQEVGVRKVMGAGRRNVVLQFWVETQLIVVLAVVVGIGLSLAGVPFLKSVIGSNVTFADLSWTEVLAASLVLALALGLVAGYYPAMLVSRLKPVSVLKSFSAFRVRPGLSRVLIVVQFSFCIVLMMAALVIDRQMDHVNHKDLGFDKDQVLLIHNPGLDPLFARQVKERLYAFAQTQPAIISQTVMTGGLSGGSNTSGFSLDGKREKMKVLTVGYNYFDLLGLKIVKGRAFNPAYPTDTVRKTRAIVVNETMWKLLGGHAQLGVFNDSIYGTIVGVVKDYHFENLSQPIQPMVHRLSNDFAGEILFKVSAGQMGPAIAGVQREWRGITNNYPFEYTFLDQSIAHMYAADMRWRKAVETGCAFAILIACLGLFGLSAITAVNRTKEIGIRKMLGATLADIAATLSLRFLGMVLVAFAIAAPIGGWLMNRWLQGYAERIGIGWWMYGLVGLAATAIALATISLQVWKSVRSNPVDALRTE